MCCVASGSPLHVPALLRPVQTELQPKAPPRLHRTGSGLFCFTWWTSEAPPLLSPTCLALNPSSSSGRLWFSWHMEIKRCCAVSLESIFTPVSNTPTKGKWKQWLFSLSILFFVSCQLKPLQLQQKWSVFFFAGHCTVFSGAGLTYIITCTVDVTGTSTLPAFARAAWSQTLCKTCPTKCTAPGRVSLWAEERKCEQTWPEFP